MVNIDAHIEANVKGFNAAGLKRYFGCSDNATTSVYSKLDHLGAKTATSFFARVEFLVLAYRYRLVDAVRDGKLSVAGFPNADERQFDNCLESGDTESVLGALMMRAEREGFLAHIRAERGPSFARWVTAAASGNRASMSYHAVCDRLITLSRRSSFALRVEFLVLTFQHNMMAPLLRYQLWDAGYTGLGERQFDACLEAGDGENVIIELIHQARREGFTDAIRAQLGDKQYQTWCSYADKQGQLF